MSAMILPIGYHEDRRLERGERTTRRRLREAPAATQEMKFSWEIPNEQPRKENHGLSHSGMQ
jgi:hypothetical protein